MIDASAATPAPPATGTQFFTGVGTILLNMITNPVTGKIYVTNTEARNETRFEGPGTVAASVEAAKPGTTGGPPFTVRGHLHEARVTVLDPTTGSVSLRHLNKHLDTAASYAQPGLAAKADSLATPVGMAITSNGTTLYVAAFGTGAVGVFDTAQLEANTFTPSVMNHIPVSGGGPSGLVLNEAQGIRRPSVHVPVSLMRANALLTERLPGNIPLTRDLLTMLEHGDNVVSNDDAVRTFRLPLVPLDEQLRQAV